MKSWWWEPEVQNAVFISSALFAPWGILEMPWKNRENPVECMRRSSGFPSCKMCSVAPNPSHLKATHPPALLGLDQKLEENRTWLGWNREQYKQSPAKEGNNSWWSPSPGDLLVAGSWLAGEGQGHFFMSTVTVFGLPWESCVHDRTHKPSQSPDHLKSTSGMHRNGQAPIVAKTKSWGLVREKIISLNRRCIWQHQTAK